MANNDYTLGQAKMQNGRGGGGRMRVAEKPKDFKAAFGMILRYCRKFVPAMIAGLSCAVASAVLTLFGPDRLGAITRLIEDGMNGLGFREHSLERIRRLRAMMHEGQHICIDGGTAERELVLAHEAGADMAVLGRMIFPEMTSNDGKHEGRILLPSEREKTPAQLLEQYNKLFQ